MAIIEAAKSNTDIAIEALAGTGKTTTLKMLADSKLGLEGTYVAFNKSIVDEALTFLESRTGCGEGAYGHCRGPANLGLALEQHH